VPLAKDEFLKLFGELLSAAHRVVYGGGAPAPRGRGLGDRLQARMLNILAMGYVRSLGGVTPFSSDEEGDA
jgi:hypothetical protein